MQSLPLQSHHIMEALSKKGHHIRVIDYEAKWKPGAFAKSLRRRRFDNVHRTDPSAGVTLIRTGMTKLPGIARVTSAASQFKEILEQALKWCDVIVLYSVPTNGIQTVLSAKLAGKPVLFHSFDVLHRMTGYRPLSAPTWAMERFVYRQVNEIIVISASLQKYMHEIGVAPEHVVLLPPAVNMDRFNPNIPKDRFRKEIGLSSTDKVVLFSGWLYDFCGIDVILESWKELSMTFPDLRLLVCGNGPLLQTLEKTRDRMGLADRVKILGKRPFDEMPSIIGSADLCINPYLPEVRSNYAFPSKLVEYMAMSKPVLATDLPGTRSLLPSESGVWLVPPRQFVASMASFIQDSDKLRDAGRRALEFCKQTFSLEQITNQFEEVLVKMNEN